MPSVPEVLKALPFQLLSVKKICVPLVIAVFRTNERESLGSAD